MRAGLPHHPGERAWAVTRPPEGRTSRLAGGPGWSSPGRGRTTGWLWWPGGLESRVAIAGFAVTAVHFAGASASGALGPLALRLALFAVSLAALVGVPAFAFGAGLYVTHLVVLGIRPAEVTGPGLFVAGVALLTLGAVECVRLAGRWWRRLLLVPAAYVLLVYLLVPLTFGVYAASVPREAPAGRPADAGLAYETVRFEDGTGHWLAGWYMPGRNAAAVVTVHGASGNRSSTMSYASLLSEAGYGVVMLDVQGFGESDGGVNNYGWAGADDVAAAVRYLQTRSDVDPQRIGALGLSMGGEILVEAAAETPNLRAVVIEGASGRTWDDYRDRPRFSWLEAPTFFVAVQTAGLLSDVPEPPPLADVASRIAPRPVLLVSADVQGEREMSRLFAARIGASASLWEIAESQHTGALALHADEYRQRVLGFFAAALGR